MLLRTASKKLLRRSRAGQSERMGTSGKTAAHILGRNVVLTFANTVCNAGEAFFCAVQADVVHADAVTYSTVSSYLFSLLQNK